MTEGDRQKSFTELEMEQQCVDWAKAYAAVRKATIDSDGDTWRRIDLEQQLAASTQLPSILIRQCLWELAREALVNLVAGGRVIRNTRR